MPPHLISFQEAVYGSFPFWDRGYALLAHSPGCPEAWLEGFRLACQKFGEPTAGATSSRAFFALKLPGGPHLIVGVEPQGADDRGRPGALAFHGLFVRPEDMKRLRYDPFALAGALRGDWGPETKFPSWDVWQIPAPEPPIGEESWISRALIGGKRVALESSEPVDEIARAAWSHLPERVRKRASVATLAFGNENRFDLVAMPRLAGAALDGTYLLRPPTPGPTKPRARLRGLRIAGIGLAVAAIGALGWIVQRPLGTRPTGAQVVDAAPPAPRFEAIEGDPGERGRILDGLVDLADRFGVLEGAKVDDPAALIRAISDRLRYRGPRLSGAELAAIRAEAGPAGEEALALDRHLGHFATDRPLPGDFDRGPIRWQVACLAWSFRVEVGKDRPATDVPAAIADALSVPGPVPTLPIEARYPALADYARFLKRLPRR